MSNEKWLFVGTDQRLRACSLLFQRRGFDTKYMATNENSSQLLQLISEWQPHHIVLPILQLEGTIPASSLPKDVRLYVGVTSKEWQQPFKNAGIELIHYLQDDIFIWHNAQLTAEAFVHEYYRRMKKQIAGSHMMIAGFGKVAKRTAHLLNAMGATITIFARSVDQLGEASTFGYEARALEETNEITSGVLINTIPAKWYTMHKNTTLHLFDLASAPGCLVKNEKPEYYTVLLGLPGKHFPDDAAAVLAGALERS